MATGNYGTIRPADVSVEDVEILYAYSPNREDLNTVELSTLDPLEVLIPTNDPNSTIEVLGGMYTLKLPTSAFGSKGYYNIIIRPKQIRTSIVGCGVLSDLADTQGVIFDINQIPSADQSKFENGNLVGYRIEYLNDDGSKINNLYRIITSNNRALQIPQTTGNGNSVPSWSFNDNTSTTFCTVTPSSAPYVKPNAVPFIGTPQQNVIITNTFFDPVMLEVEMVEYDDESLAYALYGNQTKSLEDGVYTIYNFGDQIYKQYNLYEVKDQFSGKPLYEVREKKTIIDPTKEFNNITDF
jgi:hypothetical protein